MARIVFGPWFPLWGVLFVLSLSVTSELVDLWCPTASLWPEAIRSLLNGIVPSFTVLGIALGLIVLDLVRRNWLQVMVRIAWLVTGIALWFGMLVGLIRLTEKMAPRHRVDMEILSSDCIRVNGYDLTLGEGGSFEEYLSRRHRQIMDFAPIRVDFGSRNPQLTTSDTFKVHLSLPPEMAMGQLVDKVLVPCAYSNPMYELKGLSFYTTYGAGDWECAQVFDDTLPTFPRELGIRVALGASLEADGQLDHWGYWIDAHVPCDLVPSESPEMGDSPTIRAQYRKPEMIRRVDGNIVLRVDKADTVSQFEQALSHLLRLGYTKVFVMVDGNRFICF